LYDKSNKDFDFEVCPDVTAFSKLVEEYYVWE
jgi:hypothetical protein